MKTTVRSNSPTLADRLRDVTQFSEVKRLADGILALQRQKEFRSLAVLSLFPGEGKSLFTALLAMAYADACRAKVLVVDTTSYRHPQSLVLKQCLEASHPLIDLVALEEIRQNGHANNFMEPVEGSLNAEIIQNSPAAYPMKKESDQLLIRKLSTERASQYTLILLDTSALTSYNKGNIDPQLVAHHSDATVLVVNPQLLRTAQLDAHLKALKDPALHLVGLISNEEYFL